MKSVVYTAVMTYEVKNDGPGTAIDVVATIHIFKEWSGWASQQVLATDISPTGEILSTEDNRVLSVSLGNIPAGEGRTITITQTVKVDYVDRRPLDEDSIENFVPPEFGYTSQIDHLWESEAPEIQAKAHELTDDQPNIYYKVKRIFDFVKDYLGYKEQVEEHGALWAYRHRNGDCTEFTNLFIALCRAAGIPAKFVACYGYKQELETNPERMGHAFSIIYLPDHGWVPVDLIWPLGVGLFCELSPDHIIHAVSDGTNMVRDSHISPPGGYRVDYSVTVGSPANCEILLKGGKITREVAVEPKLVAEPMMRGDIWTFSVLVNNVGKQAVTNVKVELVADATYIEVPQAESIDGLEAGAHQQVSFDARIKKSVENSALKARVTYECPYGTFLAEDQMLISVTLPAAPSEELWEKLEGILPFIIVSVIACAVIAAAIFMIRRR